MSCTFQGVFQDIFKTYPFNNTASIRFWHLHSARFGHSNDILLLINGTKSEGQDYLRGLLASSILIFSIAVVWCIILLVLKCMGPHRVGWLSGRHAPLPPNPGKEPEEDTNGEETKVQQGPTAWERKYNKIIRARRIMKALVVVAGLGIIINAIMLSVKGVKDLLHTLDGIDYVINYATGLMEEGVALIDSILYTEAQLNNETEAALDAINGICPELLQPICSNITDVETCNFEAVLENYTDVVEFLGLLAATKNEVYRQLNRTRSDLLDSIAFANSISDISQTFNWAFWCSLVFSLATALACLFFIYRAIRPPTKSSRCTCRNVFVIPCFVLLVFLSWIFAIVFVIGSVGLADMCYDSPDENFKALLQRMQNEFSPLVYKSIIFYVSGCPIGQAITEILEFVKYLSYFFQSAASAFQSLDFQNIADDCGIQSVARATDATHYVSTSVCELANLMREVHLYFECANWYPLYDEGVYQAMCYQGTSGFAWVTGTQMAIVVCSMVILSLRVVFHEIDIQDPKLLSPEIIDDQDVNGKESGEGMEIKTDEEQALAAVIVDRSDDVADKNETQVVESAVVSNMLDDDTKEDLTVPDDDSETHQGDNGDTVAVLSPFADNDEHQSTFIEEERVLVAKTNDDARTEVAEPLDDVAAVRDGLLVEKNVLKSQDKVHDEAQGTTSTVEDDQTKDGQDNGVILIPNTTDVDDEGGIDQDMVNTNNAGGEATAEPLDDFEAEAENDVVAASALLSQEKERDEAECTTFVVEGEQKIVSQENDVVLIPDATELDEGVEIDTNLVNTDTEGAADHEVLDHSFLAKENKGQNEADGTSSMVEDNDDEPDIDSEDTTKPKKESKVMTETEKEEKSSSSGKDKHEETASQSSINGDVTEEDVNQDDIVLLPAPTDINQVAATETDASADEGYGLVEPTEESERDVDDAIDRSSSLTKNEDVEFDEEKVTPSIDEDYNAQDVDQVDSLLFAGSPVVNEDAVRDENYLMINDNGDRDGESDEAMDDSEGDLVHEAVESLSVSTENTHGEKDDAQGIVDEDVVPHHIDKHDAIVSPDSLLATEESTRAISADEIWLWHTKGNRQETNSASSDDEPF